MIKSGSLKLKSLIDLLREIRKDNATGTLDIKSYYGMGSLYIKEGKIAMATSSQAMARLGRRVVEKGYVTEVQVQQALNIQKTEKKGQQLGDILVEIGFIDNTAMEALVTLQIKEVIHGMNFWQDGFFRFDPNLEKKIPSSILFDPNDFDNEEMENFISESETKTPLKNEHQVAASSIKGEIDEKLKNLSDKLRSFKSKDLILLVEDELLMRQIITDKLSDFGFIVDSVPTPSIALEKIAEYETNGKSPIIVTDLVMPSISGKGMFGGMELLERLQDEYPHLPVIMTTAYPDPNTKQKALFWGVYYYISKPDRSNATPDQLDNLFNNYMEELSLSIENIIRRRDVYFEKDHLDIIRNQLVGDLFNTKLELSEVEKTMESKVGELTFLKETSDSLVKDSNVHAVSENIINYTSMDLDRVIIFLARQNGFFAFKGKDTTGKSSESSFQQILKGISFHPSKVTIIQKIIREKSGYEGKLDSSILPIVKKLGSEIPKKIVLVPIVVEKRVVGIFYGDTMQGSLPCNNVDAIMILLNLASLSMEIAHQKTIISKFSTKGVAKQP